MIRPYLDLEDQGADLSPEIFVYPDPKWRHFEGWGEYGGWLLGPHAAPADGDQDLVFTARLLDYLEDNYCVDRARIFATGHSWGGDMAMVVACFLGDRLTAAAPVAANRPYWFEASPGDFIDCPGRAAVWTFFGAGDDHFTDQEFSGQYGDACRDFWLGERACDGPEAAEELDLGAPGECLRYQGCTSDTRYCLYAAEFGHQLPDYFSAAALTWFRGF
jgi:polyhydroxybutyrate depolymerase